MTLQTVGPTSQAGPTIENPGRLRQPLWLEKALFSRRVLGWFALLQLIVTAWVAIRLTETKRTSLIANVELVLVSGGCKLEPHEVLYSLFMVLPGLIMLWGVVRLLENVLQKAREVPGLLTSAGRLRPREGEDFVAYLQDRLYGWSWQKGALVGVVLAASIGLSVVAGVGPSGYYGDLYALPEGYGPDQQAWVVVTVILMPVVVGGVSGLAMWYVEGLRHSFKKLSPSFYSLQIEPTHRDRAGGLARLGNLYLEIALVTVVPLVFFGLLVRFRFQTDWGWLYDYIVIAGFVLLMPPTYWMGDLIADTAREMRRKRIQHQDVLAEQMAEIRERIHALIERKARLKASEIGLSEPEPDAGQDVDAEIGRYQGALEDLERLYPSDLRYPVVPFDRSVFIKVTSAQVTSVLWLVFGLQGGDGFQTLLNFVFRPGG